MFKRWLTIALINLFLAACLGLLMRLAFVTDIPWIDYRNIMHGHSHVAMLGWLYLSLFALLVHSFMREKANLTYYNRLFWLTQGSVVGMFIAFPLEGYALWSILFSTLHILFSYIFAYRIFKDLKSDIPGSSLSVLFVKTALALMILSTLALLAMPPIMISGMGQSAVYYGAVQFFLHFQFNGFYIFAILALFFRWLEVGGVVFNVPRTRQFYRLLLTSCLLTYVLAVTWSTPIPLLFWINGLGVLIQLAALVVFCLIIRAQWPHIRRLASPAVSVLLGLSFISFCIKIIIQTAVVIPHIAVMAYTIRNYVIGFIHLILLGMITAAVLAFAIEKKWIFPVSRSTRLGMITLFAGIILTELVLFIQGTFFWAEWGFLPYYYEVITGISILMPLGIFVILVKRLEGSVDI